MADRSEQPQTLALAQARPVALLFTDIEGSTTRWESYPEAMAAALREHDRTVREAIEFAHGRVFKTVGDAFYAIFENAYDAVCAALRAQRALGRVDWTAVDGLRVRMAVHVGSVEARDDDYFGSTLNRIARLIGIAHGGQILVSERAAADLEGTLPVGASLVRLGEHRLKDLSHAERVSQVSADGLQTLFPPLRSLTVLPNNLPSQPTSFIGRGSDLRVVREMLAATRVLTITGAGGIGKTRLALALGSELLDAYPQGVFFVEFAPLAAPEAVVEAVAAALELRPSAATMERTLLDFLTARRMLLIFDNCEHLVAEISRLTSAIVRACPQIAIVASSREALRATGERTYRLPSLDVPADDVDAGFAEIANCDAVSLFVSRATAVDHRFALTETNAPIVAEICRRVDGIALAIELAAARVAILSPESIRARIAKRLVILTRGNRSALPRQQTVRALIDWSYDLLDERERRFFERLGVFGDSFSLDAALVVARVGDDLENEFDLLAALVDKSLVSADLDAPAGRVRYRLLETLREYALEKLVAAHAFDETMDRFAGWYVAFVERSFTLWERATSREWEAFTAAEIPNVRAVLTWLDAGSDRQRIAATIARARRLFARIAPAEGFRWIASVCDGRDARTPPHVRAELDLARAQMLTALRKNADALTSAHEAIEAFAALGDDLGLAEARGFAGLALTMLGENERGEALLDEAIAAYERGGAVQLRAYALSDLGVSRYFGGDYRSAVDLLERARDAFVALGNERAAIVTMSNLADVRFGMGDAADALHLIDAAIAADPESRDQAVFFANKAMYLTALDRFEEALVAARSSLRRARGASVEVEVAITLKHIAAIAVLRGARDGERADVVRAARVFAIAEKLMETSGATIDPANACEAERAREAFVRVLGEEAVRRIRDESGSIPLALAIAEAGTL